MKNPTKVWQFNHFHKKNSNREKKESNFYEQKKKFLKLFIFFSGSMFYLKNFNQIL